MQSIAANASMIDDNNVRRVEITAVLLTFYLRLCGHIEAENIGSISTSRIGGTVIGFSVRPRFPIRARYGLRHAKN